MTSSADLMREATKALKVFGLESLSGSLQSDPLDAPDGTPWKDDGAGAVEKVKGRRMDAITASRQLLDDPTNWQSLIDAQQVISPPYDPHALIVTVEESSTLPFLIDTMATNIGGFGVDLVPLFEARDPETGEELPPPPEALEERGRLLRFLQTCKIPDGIEGVMDKVDRDVETIGWGGMEILRDKAGRVAAIEHVPGKSLRLGPQSEPIYVEVPFRDPETGEIVLVPRYRRFRTVFQIDGGSVVYFREFGDPRPINRKTGEYGDAGTRWGGGLDGTEIKLVRLYSVHTPYGVPRWIGAAQHARVEREAGDLILSWYLDAPIGVKLAMVAGAAWDAKVMKKALDKVDRVARGADNAWTVVALEAEAAGGGTAFDSGTSAGSAKMMLEDLVMTLPPEIYFGEGNMIDQSGRRLARSFRLPPIYWGASDDYSRAAVTSAKSFGEEQVMRPVRRLRWENPLNNEMLPAMGINHWHVRLKGANTSDDTEIAKSIGAFVQGGGAAPNALITLWNDLTGQDVPRITESWGDRPMQLTMALLGGRLDPNAGLAEVAEGFAAEPAGGLEAGPEQDPEAADAPPTTKAQKAAMGSASEMVLELQQFVHVAQAELQQMDPSWMA